MPSVLLLFMALLAIQPIRGWASPSTYEYQHIIQPVLHGTADSPYRYRILTPLILSALERGIGYTSAYMVFHGGVVMGLFAALYTWLRHWASSSRALVGCLIVAAAFPMMAHAPYTAWTSLEALLLAVGLILIIHTQGAWSWRLAGLIALATLNRETALLIPAAHVAIYRNRVGGLYCVLWAGLVMGLHIGLGTAPDTLTLAEVWTRNTHTFRFTRALETVPILCLIPVMAALRWHDTPPALHALAGVALLHLGAVAVGSQWYEVRLWMPAIILLAPMISYEDK